ncbi:MAG TPA: MOSC domain-containing protein [Woeseiaceae bacterium]|nr:MOSC domain-containing protein [Woeseiaceae bacterium]
MELMRVVSVNVGRAATVRHGRTDVLTGIDKRPAGSAVRVTELGVEADAIVDTAHHGGADQAVYAYGADDYAWWAGELGRELRYGTFGENLTIAGFPHDMNAGDRLLVGDVILEATAPRIPCSTLAAQMQDPNFGLRFRDAERPGTYFRVLNAGEVAPNDPVTLVENPGESVTMLELFRAWYDLHPREALLKRIVEAPVAERARARFQAKLDALAG